MEFNGKQMSLMEFANGGDLSHFLVQRQKKQRGISNSEVTEIFFQICNGVRYLHTHGIVHGDLAPQNILMNFEDGEVTVKVTDYFQNNKQRLMYSAPEVIDGKSPTPQSDVWSLGVILYQLVTMKLPFEQVGAIFTQKPDLENVRDSNQRKII